MQNSNLTINLKNYIIYKFLNSLFLGLSVGSVFVLYTPLKPSIYSLGGIALAIGMLIIAKLYPYIMTIQWFFRFSMLVELIILIVIIYFLLNPYTYTTALFIYIGYQITFMFGSYLVRAETLALDDDEKLSKVDMAKQIGYLAGMLISYLFYKSLETLYQITNKQTQVYDLHYILLVNELLIILFLYNSFRRKWEFKAKSQRRKAFYKV